MSPNRAAYSEVWKPLTLLAFSPEKCCSAHSDKPQVLVQQLQMQRVSSQCHVARQAEHLSSSPPALRWNLSGLKLIDEDRAGSIACRPGSYRPTQDLPEITQPLRSGSARAPQAAKKFDNTDKQVWIRQVLVLIKWLLCADEYDDIPSRLQL